MLKRYHPGMLKRYHPSPKSMLKRYHLPIAIPIRTSCTASPTAVHMFNREEDSGDCVPRTPSVLRKENLQAALSPSAKISNGRQIRRRSRRQEMSNSSNPATERRPFTTLNMVTNWRRTGA